MLLGVSAASQQAESPTSEKQVVRPSAAERDLLDINLAYAGALYNLARERFVAHEAKNEIWILCINDSVGTAALKKYSDGKFFVVSIPTLDHEREGVCHYVSHYNSFNVRKADLLALGGKYGEALKILGLLKRFDTCALAKNADLETRIALVEKLRDNQDTAANVERLRKMTVEHAPSVLEVLESKTAIAVTNLFELSVNTWESSK